jgi:hypothetical protein
MGRTARPLRASKINGYEYSETAVNEGFRLMGLPTLPQTAEFSRVLGAVRRGPAREGRHVPAYDKVAITAPRRTSKTTSIWGELVGRCETQPGHSVITTAQTGKVGRKRLLSVASLLVRNGYVRRSTGDTGHITVGYGIGNEHITWDNGSSIVMLPPKPSAWRSDAADTVLIDEAQEFDDVDESAALLDALMPLFDTRESAQLITAGTPGEHRRGLLWRALELGRAGSWGIVEYAAPPDTPQEKYGDPRLWTRVHPGIGTLTTMRVIKQRWIDYAGDDDPSRFGREYLGIWPDDQTVRVIPAAAWARCRVPDDQRPARPPRVSLGYDVAPAGNHAAIAAAWKDAAGDYHVEIIGHDDANGYRWLAPRLRALAPTYRAPIGYDPIGPNVHVAETLTTGRPRVTLKPLTMRQLQAACSRWLADVKDGRLRHQAQPPLDDAVAGAARRVISEAGWVWGRRTPTADVSALIAATVALHGVDDLPTGAATVIHTLTR